MGWRPASVGSSSHVVRGSSLPSLVGVGDGVELGVGDDAGAVKVEC